MLNTQTLAGGSLGLESLTSSVSVLGRHGTPLTTSRIAPGLLGSLRSPRTSFNSSPPALTLPYIFSFWATDELWTDVWFLQSIYYVGGFGSEHFIGYIPLEMYQTAFDDLGAEVGVGGRVLVTQESGPLDQNWLR